MPAGRRAELAVIVETDQASVGPPKPLVVTADRQLKRLVASDFTTDVEALANIRLPRNFNARSPQSRRDLVSTLRTVDIPRPERAKQRSAAADDAEIARLRVALRAHPCHSCPDRETHARWAERHDRLRRDTDVLERRMSSRTGSIARTFDSVCNVLTALGYLADDAVTPAGRTLTRLYSESDLVVAESLRTGAWDDLDSAELAAVVSALIYEARRDDDAAPKLPPGRVRDGLDALGELWLELHQLESDHGLTFLREPERGFAWMAWRWAKGHTLDAVLRDSPLAAGDFVRCVKQLIDLLDQIVDAAPEGSPVAGTARTALGQLRRGVVAYSAVA
jgi:ATP-dependent RNA helicase HelY